MTKTKQTKRVLIDLNVPSLPMVEVGRTEPDDCHSRLGESCTTTLPGIYPHLKN